MVPHYRGDGIIPDDGGAYAPAGDEKLSHDDEVREMAHYYRSVADDLGELFLPADPPNAGPGWLDQCKRLGASWVYARPKNETGQWHLDVDRIREGPPG